MVTTTSTTVRHATVDLHVSSAGRGPALVLLHGWPHTSALWDPVVADLARDHHVLAPDLRGTGGSSRPESGYDLHTLADDVVAVLDGHDVPDAVVVGIDAGAPVAFLSAMRHPDRVRGLAVMEGLIGRLPGAEGFLAAGPPWWFGFHSVPGFAETVLEGHEEAYLDWFLRGGTADGQGVDPATRAAFVAAYRGRDALRGGFEHYRAMPGNAAQIADAVAAGRLTVPTLAVAGGVVGDAVARQLEPVADDLTAITIPGCAHLIPQEQPTLLADALRALSLRAGH